MQCVPVPRMINPMSFRSMATAAKTRQIICSYCDTKKEQMSMNEYGHCKCADCCRKILMNDKGTCARCDRRESLLSSLIINYRSLCNVCVNGIACKVMEQDGRTNLLLELTKLRAMMQGELPPGERVTVRSLSAEAFEQESNSFWMDGNNCICPFGPAGVIVTFTPCKLANSSLSKGTYTIQLETGGLIDVPSADGLRYEGQILEIRYWTFKRSSFYQ